MSKGQLIPIAFLIFLVAGILIGYIFFNTYYGTRYKIQALQISVIDAVGNIIQSLKNYLMISLSYSDLQSLREHACLGGSVGAAPWIVNGPNPMSVQKSKECLEKYTRYYFNVYYSMFNSSLPVEMNKYSNYTTCVYGVDEGKVFAGDYDEGNFWANCSEATVIISGANRNISFVENFNDADFVTKNRYWYLFRNFYDWANADVYSPCICGIIGCGCSSGSGEEECSSCSFPVSGCAETALQDLQNRFDSFVTCRKDKLCCKQGAGGGCGAPTPCLPWENACMSIREHNCVDPSIGKRGCPANPGGSDDGGCVDTNSIQTFGSAKKISYREECEPCYSEARVSAGYKFTCEDHKYYVPSDKGPVPLTFSVTAYAFFRAKVCPCCC